MSSAVQTISTPAVSKSALWTGRIMSGLVVAFLLMDGVMKFLKPAAVVKGMADVQWPMSLSVPLGIILLTCVVIYVIPRTSVLGAILLTGYLGGAVATHLRIGDPLFSHILAPVYFGILIWGGLYFRDTRLRALIPFRY